MYYKEAKERRACVRFPVPIPIDCKESNFSSPTKAKTSDISNIGLGIITEKALSPGAEMDISLQMGENAEVVRTKGRLIWSMAIESGKYRSGVRLEKPRLNAILLVLKVIKARLKY